MWVCKIDGMSKLSKSSRIPVKHRANYDVCSTALCYFVFCGPRVQPFNYLIIHHSSILEIYAQYESYLDIDRLEKVRQVSTIQQVSLKQDKFNWKVLTFFITESSDTLATF